MSNRQRPIFQSVYDGFVNGEKVRNLQDTGCCYQGKLSTEGSTQGTHPGVFWWTVLSKCVNLQRYRRTVRSILEK